MKKILSRILAIFVLLMITSIAYVNAETSWWPVGGYTTSTSNNAPTPPAKESEKAFTPPAKCPDGKTNCPEVKASTSKATGFKLNIRLNNPLKVSSIQEALKFFMNLVLKIALPIIIIFFVWSGLSFILARGNATKIQEAKNMFLYTVIGTLLVLGAWTITNALIGTVNSIAN